MSEILGDRLIRIIRYLEAHPRRSAREIGMAVGFVPSQEAYRLLQDAALKGYVTYSRDHPAGPWLWEACPEGIAAVVESDRLAREGAS